MAPVHLVKAAWSGALGIQAHPPVSDIISVIQDSLSGRFVDSVVVRSPLPDPARPDSPMDLPAPGWVMVSGIVIGALRRARGPRAAMAPTDRRSGHWLVTRDRGVKLALGAAVGAVLLLVLAGRAQGA